MLKLHQTDTYFHRIHQSEHESYFDLFEFAPTALWLQDMSRVKQHFDALRVSGIQNLRDFFDGQVDRILQCAAIVPIVHVNQKGLDLFGARDIPHLELNKIQMFSEASIPILGEEFAQLWDGKIETCQTYCGTSIDGRPLSVQTIGRLLPGSEQTWNRYIISIEDVTEREASLRRVAESESYAHQLFDHCPTALWLEDLSALKVQFELWRAEGVNDFRRFLEEDPSNIFQCFSLIKVDRMNRRTVNLHEAEDASTMMQNFHKIFPDPTTKFNVDLLVSLWNDSPKLSLPAVNYTLTGRRVDVQLSGSVMPGHEDTWKQWLISTEDVTSREDARRKASASEFYANQLFELSPVALWLEDLSELKSLFELWRSQGVSDITSFLKEDPARVITCFKSIKIIKVNKKTLEQRESENLDAFLRDIHNMIPDPKAQFNVDRFASLWNNNLNSSQLLVGYTTKGRRLDIQLNSTVLPGYEETWEQWLISTEDVTAREDGRRKAEASELYANQLFELSPVALWLEDLSELKNLFDLWRSQGVRDIQHFLAEDPERVIACYKSIKILKANKIAMIQRGFKDFDAFLKHMHNTIPDPEAQFSIDRFASLWNNNLNSTQLFVAHTMNGGRLDIQLNSTVLPGHEETWQRWLISTEDVTAREDARRKAAASEAYARNLFDHSPASLWVCDLSRVKQVLETEQTLNSPYLPITPDVFRRVKSSLIAHMTLIDMNKHSLKLVGDVSKSVVFEFIGQLISDEARDWLTTQVINLWYDQPLGIGEFRINTIDGKTRFVQAQFSILPGHDDNWSRVLVALMDITARKEAEAHLVYLSNHDPLTKLYSRSYFHAQLERLEHARKAFPVSLIAADVNGLKPANDRHGHSAGDDLLRRAGDILLQASLPDYEAARIGGDEFVILMPGADAATSLALRDRIKQLIADQNATATGPLLSMSIGVATAMPDESAEDMLKRADADMYEQKRQFYDSSNTDHRSRSALQPEVDV